MNVVIDVSAAVNDQCLSCQGNCVDGSLWQPQRHENTHYRAVSRGVRDAKSEWDLRKVLSVGGK